MELYIKDRDKIRDVVKMLDDMSTKYLTNTNLYMKINTTKRLLQDIESTIEFIEEEK